MTLIIYPVQFSNSTLSGSEAPASAQFVTDGKDRQETVEAAGVGVSPADANREPVQSTPRAAEPEAVDFDKWAEWCRGGQNR